MQAKNYGEGTILEQNAYTQHQTGSQISFAIGPEYGGTDPFNSASQSTIEYDTFDQGRGTSLPQHADSAIDLSRRMSPINGSIGYSTGYDHVKEVRIAIDQPQIKTDRLIPLIKSTSVEVVKKKRNTSAKSRRIL